MLRLVRVKTEFKEEEVTVTNAKISMSLTIFSSTHWYIYVISLYQFYSLHVELASCPPQLPGILCGVAHAYIYRHAIIFVITFRDVFSSSLISSSNVNLAAADQRP